MELQATSTTAANDAATGQEKILIARFIISLLEIFAPPPTAVDGFK
jgi:hypothetical protein